MYKFFCCIALFLLISCSSEKSIDTGKQKFSETTSDTARKQSQPSIFLESGSYSLELTPENATRNSTLRVSVQGFRLSDAKIEWLLNGYPTANSNSSHFDARETQRGDKIQVKAVVLDKEAMSNIVEIKNAPPEITRVKMLPEIFKQGDSLNVDVSASDIDGDELSIAYEWTKNGEPEGNGNRLDVPVKRGDKISVKITPFDGELYGPTVILQREIKNMPPMIIKDEEFHFDGNVYIYQVKATDPDGDAVMYSLKTAPAEMNIEPSTGLIRWNVPPAFKGKTPVTVSVNDGHGGEALYDFNITIDLTTVR